MKICRQLFAPPSGGLVHACTRPTLRFATTCAVGKTHPGNEQNGLGEPDLPF